MAGIATRSSPSGLRRSRPRPKAPLLDLERALDLAEIPSLRLCTWCGCAQEVAPLLRGFGHIADT
jgi:hypothetical protein